MITEEELLKAGYKEYPGRHKQYVDAYFQKTIWVDRNNSFAHKYSESKKAFFINVYMYNSHLIEPRIHKEPSFSSDVRFYTASDSFDIQLFHESKYTIQQMEEFYKQFYLRNNCIPDLHNND